MKPSLLPIGTVASLAAFASAQSTATNKNASVAPWPESVVDFGNGVHGKSSHSFPPLRTQATDPETELAVPGAIPANLREPLQHRLAFHGANGMTVSWSTFKQLEQPTVYFGTDPKCLDQVATSTASTTYDTSRTFNNHVTLSGLDAGTKYWYRGDSLFPTLLLLSRRTDHRLGLGQSRIPTNLEAPTDRHTRSELHDPQETRRPSRQRFTLTLG